MKVQVCQGKTCKERFSNYILTRLENDKEFYNWKKVELDKSPCMGQCKKGPNVMIDGKINNYMDPAKASTLIQKSKK